MKIYGEKKTCANTNMKEKWNWLRHTLRRDEHIAK